jgi:ketosteroid isomerase-like protein
MRNFVLVLLSACALSVASFAKDAQAEVLAAEKARTAAMVKGDLDALNKLLADDLSYVHASGSTDTKATFLASIRAGDLRYISFHSKAIQTRVLGTSAILNGEYVIHVLNKRLQPDPLEIDAYFLAVYAHRDGRWQLVAWQTTRAPAPSQAGD